MKDIFEQILLLRFPSKTMVTKLGFLVALIISSTLVACERDLSIEVDNENPPTFRLKGSGRLVFFNVFEVPPNHTPVLGDPVLWEIKPIGETIRISKLPSITYGVVPSGFVQTIPKSGAPPLLKENQTYEAGGPADEANGGSIRFRLENGKAVLVER